MKRICLCAVAVMLVVGLNGCKNGVKNEGPLPVLDFRADIPDREAALQDLGKVRYFRLQTPENVLLGDWHKLRFERVNDCGNPACGEIRLFLTVIQTEKTQ